MTSLAIGEVCTIIDYRGKTPLKSASGIPLITAKNIDRCSFNVNPREYIAEESYEEWMSRGTPQSGDVLFTTEAPLGHVCLIPEINGRFAVGQRLLTLRPKEQMLNNVYLSKVLQSDSFQAKLRQRSTGTTVTGIRSKEFVKLEIGVPDLALQNRFATFVEQLDKSKFRVLIITYR